MGFRFILLSDDNFYPVTMEDLRLAERQGNTARLESLSEIRRERFELMELLAKLPDDLVFYTQITMEAAEDPEFLKAMNKAKIRGALVGVESVTPEGLKAIFKDFNYAGDKLVTRLKEFRKHGVHILGSFIFGLPTDKEDTFDATAELAQTRRHRVCAVHHADAVSRHRRFREMGREDGVGPDAHCRLSADAVLADSARPAAEGLHAASDAVARADPPGHAVDLGSLLQHSRNLGAGEHHQVAARARSLFVMISKLYRQMYANTGIATDSARVTRSAQWARWLARPCRKLFVTTPMPDLQVPELDVTSASGFRLAAAVGRSQSPKPEASQLRLDTSRLNRKSTRLQLAFRRNDETQSSNLCARHSSWPSPLRPRRSAEPPARSPRSSARGWSTAPAPRPSNDSVILVSGDRITAAGPRAQVQVPQGATVVNACGQDRHSRSD